MKTMEEVATFGAKAQYDVDRYLTLARKAALRVEKATEMGVTLGMVKPIRGKIMIAESRAATGSIAYSAKAFADLHREQTLACVENNCDVPALKSVGGVSTFGGGDR